MALQVLRAVEGGPLGDHELVVGTPAPRLMAQRSRDEPWQLSQAGRLDDVGVGRQPVAGVPTSPGQVRAYVAQSTERGRLQGGTRGPGPAPWSVLQSISASGWCSGDQPEPVEAVRRERDEVRQLTDRRERRPPEQLYRGHALPALQGQLGRLGETRQVAHAQARCRG